MRPSSVPAAGVPSCPTAATHAPAVIFRRHPHRQAPPLTTHLRSKMIMTDPEWEALIDSSTRVGAIRVYESRRGRVVADTALCGAQAPKPYNSACCCLPLAPARIKSESHQRPSGRVCRIMPVLFPLKHPRIRLPRRPDHAELARAKRNRSSQALRRSSVPTRAPGPRHRGIRTSTRCCTSRHLVQFADHAYNYSPILPVLPRSNMQSAP